MFIFKSLGSENAGKCLFIQRLEKGGLKLICTRTVPYKTKVSYNGLRLELKYFPGYKIHRFLTTQEKQKKPDALIYIIDANEPATIESSIQNFNTLLRNKIYFGIPILVLGNKIDKITCLSLGEFQNLLNKYVDQIIANYEVLMISAYRNIGIDDVADSLRRKLHK